MMGKLAMFYVCLATVLGKADLMRENWCLNSRALPVPSRDSISFSILQLLLFEIETFCWANLAILSVG
jgi:hypothetical protein